jgi:predicted outer membrane lipoprotein
MRYVTSIERLAMEEGREEGREEGLQVGIRQSILGVLQARFGVVSAMATGRLEQVEDMERLQALLGQAATAESLTSFEAFLADDEG